MRARRSGRILNLSSDAGQVGGTVTGAHYSASKAAVLVLTKVVARELAPFGVTVNAIAPGAVRTPTVEAWAGPEGIQRVSASIPVGRIGEASEIGALAAFLASDKAGYVTGAAFDVNGGVFMR
jgi:3-oxoacyl-[acyl-carrier protein] reductase